MQCCGSPGSAPSASRWIHLPACRTRSLLILPTTRSALMLARQVCAGPRLPHRRRPHLQRACLGIRAAVALADGARAVELRPSRTCRARSSPFPTSSSATICRSPGFASSVRGTRSPSIEALLVLRHRPRVFALRSCSPAGDFRLTEVFYADLLDAQDASRLVAGADAPAARGLGERAAPRRRPTGSQRAGSRSSPNRTGASWCAKS